MYNKLTNEVQILISECRYFALLTDTWSSTDMSLMVCAALLCFFFIIYWQLLNLQETHYCHLENNVIQGPFISEWLLQSHLLTSIYLSCYIVLKGHISNHLDIYTISLTYLYTCILTRKQVWPWFHSWQWPVLTNNTNWYMQDLPLCLFQMWYSTHHLSYPLSSSLHLVSVWN